MIRTFSFTLIIAFLLVLPHAHGGSHERKIVGDVKVKQAKKMGESNKRYQNTAKFSLTY